MTDEPRERIDPVEEPDDTPAPVVTDSGVYGTPAPRVTLRDLEQTRYRGSATWLTGAVTVFAIAVAVWLMAFTTAQVTSPPVAGALIGRGIEAITGLESHLVLHEREIRIAAAAAPGADAPVAVPGFEVRGASLTRAQVEAGGPAEWHAALLDAAAEAVRRDGIDALALTDQATGGGWFSNAGGARLVMHVLSDSNHGVAVTLSWAAGIAAVAFGALVLYGGHGVGRLQALGVGLVLAAVPVGVTGLLSVLLIGFAGSDGSPLAETVSGMAGEVARAPLRNASTFGFLGLAIAVPALLARLILDRREPGLAAE